MSTEVSEKKQQGDLVAIQGRINKCHLAAKSVQVTSDLELQQAALGLKACVSIEKAIKDFFNPDIQKAHELHKSLCDKRSAHLKPVELARVRFNACISAYHFNALRQRKAEEARLRKEAGAAERKRQAEEKETLEFEQAEAAGYLEGSGDEAGAEALRNAPVTPSEQPLSIAPLPAAPKTEGLHFRDNWKWRVVDANIVPRDYLILNEKLLNSVAKSAKGAAKVPGIEFYNEPKPVTR